jgi:hypothetical protein
MVFLKVPRTGKLMPVNADTVRPEDQAFDPQRHTSHFATCPAAGQFRKGR